jgi:ribosome-binding factor A
MAESIRIRRLESLIQKRVATVLLRDLHDPRVSLVTVTAVRLSRDLSSCRIRWSTLEEGGRRRAVSRALDDAAGYVQREVAAILDTRTVPRIVFEFDPSIEGADRVHRLLRGLREESGPEPPAPAPVDPA